jgi:sec-independent protein translocase protein TatC
MGFIEHLDELRKRLIRVCLGVGVGMVVAFAFIDQLVDFVLAPALAALPPGSHLISTQPGEGFSFTMTVALIAGFILSSPYVAYQVWLFIAPALYAKEKRFAIPFVLLTSVGALCGAAFAHYLVFPSMIAFLATFGSRAIVFMPRVEDTFDMYLRTVGGMVLAFQMPTLVFFLAKMRLVTAGFLWRHIKYAILMSFVAAAVLTPSPDPWNQLMFAGPLIGLYLISIVIAWLVRPKAESTMAENSAKLRLVIGATVIDQAIRQRRPAAPRTWTAALRSLVS